MRLREPPCRVGGGERNTAAVSQAFHSSLSISTLFKLRCLCLSLPSVTPAATVAEQLHCSRREGKKKEGGWVLSERDTVGDASVLLCDGCGEGC